MKALIKGAMAQFASRLGPQRGRGSEPRLWVLMYHRILPATDPRFALEEPGMIVTPETFRQQLRQLKSLFELMPLGEWIDRQQAGKPLPIKACAVTFDDGWLDNHEYAFPILQEEQVPATLFAVADMIGTHRQFWPNRLARVLDAPNKSAASSLLDSLGVPIDTQPDRDAMAAIIDRSKQLSDDDLHARLDAIERALDLPAITAPALMGWDQLRAMQNSGVVEIGSHTCNHYRLLSTLAPATMTHEIVASKRRLEDELSRPVSLFCYPNGDVCPAAIDLVRSHYRGAVTTRRGINRANMQPHELLRIGVHQDIGNTPTRFEARLSGWV
jgi:peptidoglycan/xylan/chitin deacetylase (PgdA/CDA1 family)